MGNKVKVTALGERELVITREFDAPRRLVFAAHTEPELVRRWLLGPDGWTMTVCDIDLRVGGRFRYVWKRDGNGEEMGMGGDYREIKAPERIVNTEKFDQCWYAGEAVGTLVLTERDGRTTVTQTMLYESGQARDTVLASPMESGLSAGYDRLDRVLAAETA
ncbi:ATPase [Solimonas sp. K1W22B-7]|uniref:SRPBCC family protein n=1 Tax=Solimonas sp. K1W22B-7 TaxID=2303331 RepID=UPI000E32ECBC|nr:SRPBCC family protein [Solimonas sp. K1W22B-7]AXQ30088.1 ATPase [Solimonas sp. K1W22B-7]